MQSTGFVRRALISVSDKSHLPTLARVLMDRGIEVISTGGTYAELARLGVGAVKVGDYTGVPEILDGRVKTLHPRIHGGILALPTEPHQQELQKHDISPIDLVVVNLYPFARTVRTPGCTFEQAIEQIDVGGPTMLRAAAKNWPRVTAVVDPRDYERLAAALDQHDGCIPEPLRRELARKAFAHTAAYDAEIADYLARHDDHGLARPDHELVESMFVVGRATGELRYGENPHQQARFYRLESGDSEPGGLDRAVVHQGKALSYNNLLDADAALAVVRELADLGPVAAVIKHVSPCGVAVGATSDGLASVYASAREADAESAFGGIVAVSRTVGSETAERLCETFLEVVLAPEYEPEALARLSNKKNLRVLSLPGLLAPCRVPPVQLRSIAGGVLAQRMDRRVVSLGSPERAGAGVPTPEQLRDLDIAWRIVMHVRSNAIVLVHNGVTVGIGGGQTSRVEAVRQALARAGRRGHGAVLASDAFFPFRDSVDEAARAGVQAIVQPGGSMRDDEVLAAAREQGIVMLLTGERHFKH